MTPWTRRPDRWLAAGFCAAVLVALLASRSPVAAAALVLLAVVVLFANGNPVALLGVLVLSNAVRWAVLPFPLMPSVFLAQKALLFIVLALLLLRRGSTWLGLAPVLVLSIGAISTWVLSDPLPGLTYSQTVQSWATLVLVWFAVSLRLERTEWRSLLKYIVWVPLVSVLVGTALVVAGLQASLLAADSTGTQRLAGATIPAYLAAVSACAVVAGAFLARERGWWVAPTVLNLTILFATSGRGAILFAVIALSPYVVAAVFSRRRSGTARIYTTVGLAIALAVVATVFVPIVLARTETSGGLNSSGREEAWSFFLRLTEDNTSFGRGLGAGPLAASFAPRGVLPDTFVAQHSEYVRLILELGYVGLFLFVTAMLVTFAGVVRLSAQYGRGWIAAGAVLGFLVYSGTDNTLTDFQFGVPVGLIFGAMAASARSASSVMHGDRSHLLERPNADTSVTAA